MVTILQTTYCNPFHWKKTVIQIWLKFVAKGSVNNKASLGQIMAWHQTGTGTKPLSGSIALFYWHINASLSLDESTALMNQRHCQLNGVTYFFYTTPCFHTHSLHRIHFPQTTSILFPPLHPLNIHQAVAKHKAHCFHSHGNCLLADLEELTNTKAAYIRYR